MKTTFLKLAFYATAAITLAACTNDNEKLSDGNPLPTWQTSGAYIINEGVEGNKIAGSITTIDAITWAVNQNMFAAVNGRSLGLTPNHAVIYGSKMYIAVSAENTIEVVDKNTLRSIKQIKTQELMGEDKGRTPRELCTAGNNVYFSTYSGYVAAIDTTQFALQNVYQVGSYPEGLSHNNGYIYVANSNQALGKGNLSEINIATRQVISITNTNIKNPVNTASYNDGTYILDLGTYDAANDYNQTGAAVFKLWQGNITKITDATMMATLEINGRLSKIYVVNAPYSYPVKPAEYMVYDLETGKLSNLSGIKVDAPSAIAVDPVTHNIFVASYNVNPDYEMADYNAPGYVSVYKEDGTFVQKIAAGVGPTTIVFNHIQQLQTK